MFANPSRSVHLFFSEKSFHSISFTRAQGIPKYKIGCGKEKDGRVGERLVGYVDHIVRLVLVSYWIGGGGSGALPWSRPRSLTGAIGWQGWFSYVLVVLLLSQHSCCSRDCCPFAPPTLPIYLSSCAVGVFFLVLRHSLCGFAGAGGRVHSGHVSPSGCRWQWRLQEADTPVAAPTVHGGAGQCGQGDGQRRGRLVATSGGFKLGDGVEYPCTHSCARVCLLACPIAIHEACPAIQLPLLLIQLPCDL